MLRRCDKCGCYLQYLDNTKNNLTFLICPKCNTTYDDEKGISVEERISQGYSRYVRYEESLAEWMKENIIDNDDI